VIVFKQPPFADKDFIQGADSACGDKIEVAGARVKVNGVTLQLK